MIGFAETPSSLVGGICFSGALVVASVTDVRSRRIPNVLVLVLAILGVAYSALVSSTHVGVPRALMGLALGFGLWIPFYALRMLGAGDVKLFAAASCWLAPSQIVGGALAAAVVGGLLSLVGLVLAHGFGLTAFRIAHAVREPKMLATPLPVPSGRRTLPYGVAMSVGLLIAGWFPQWLRLG